MKNSDTSMVTDRRNLLRIGGATALALPFLGTGRLLAGDHNAGDPLQNMIVINNLGGVSNPNLRLLPKDAASNPVAGSKALSLDARALDDLMASGTTAINVTLGYVAGPEDPFEYSVAEIARWNRIIAHHDDRLMKVWSAADIMQAKRAGKVGIIMGFQNATMMGDRADRAAVFAGLGVKVIQLTYNVRNQIGDGSMVAENRGLTDFGREVVGHLNDANTVIDLSHSGEQTCLDAIRASNRPICISHTGCRALADLPRNKSDEELHLLADKGGVVGIYFMPFLKEDSFPDASDVVAHIEHAINVCGEDHVGIGTDGGTTAVDDMPAYHKIIDDEIERRQKAGISAKGEKKGIVPFLPDLQGPDQFRKLAGMLAARGHSRARIEKVLGGNFLRFYRDIWGA